MKIGISRFIRFLQKKYQSSKIFYNTKTSFQNYRKRGSASVLLRILDDIKIKFPYQTCDFYFRKIVEFGFLPNSQNWRQIDFIPIRTRVMADLRFSRFWVVTLLKISPISKK